MILFLIFVLILILSSTGIFILCFEYYESYRLPLIVIKEENKSKTISKKLNNNKELANELILLYFGINILHYTYDLDFEIVIDLSSSDDSNKFGLYVSPDYNLKNISDDDDNNILEIKIFTSIKYNENFKIKLLTIEKINSLLIQQLELDFDKQNKFSILK